MNVLNLMIESDYYQRLEKRWLSDGLLLFKGVSELPPFEYLRESKGMVILLCRKGRGRFYFDEKEYEVKENDFLFITLQAQSIRLERNDDFMVAGFWVGPDIYSMLHPLSPLAHPDKNPVIKLSMEDNFSLSMIYALLMEILTQPTNTVTLKTIAIALNIVFFHSAKSDLVSQDVKKPNTRADFIVDAFIEDFDKMFAESRSVGFYAQRLCITVNYLNKCCKRVLGCSAQECINQRLIYHAQRLMQDRHLIIKEVAIALGFPNLTSFSKFFRKQTGQTPSEFIKASILRKNTPAGVQMP